MELCSPEKLRIKIIADQIDPQDFIDCPGWLAMIKGSCQYLSLACENRMIKSFHVLMRAGAKIDSNGEPNQCPPIIVCLRFLSKIRQPNYTHHIEDYYVMMEELFSKLVLQPGFSPREPLMSYDWESKRSILSFFGKFNLSMPDKIIIKYLEQYIVWEDIPRVNIEFTVDIIDSMTFKRSEMVDNFIHFLMTYKDPHFAHNWPYIIDVITKSTTEIQPLLTSIMTKLHSNIKSIIDMVTHTVIICRKNGAVVDFTFLFHQLYKLLGKEEFEKILAKNIQEDIRTYPAKRVAQSIKSMHQKKAFKEKFFFILELLQFRVPETGERWDWFQYLTEDKIDSLFSFFYCVHGLSEEERALIDPYFEFITLKDLWNEERRYLREARDFRSQYLLQRIPEIYTIIKDFCVTNYSVQVTPLVGLDLSRPQTLRFEFSIDAPADTIAFAFWGDTTEALLSKPAYTREIELMCSPLINGPIVSLFFDDSDKTVLRWIDSAMASWGFLIKESTRIMLNNYLHGQGTAPKIQKIPTSLIAHYLGASSQQQMMTRTVVLALLDQRRAKNIQRRKKQSQQQEKRKKQSLLSIFPTSTMDHILDSQVYNVMSLEYQPIRNVLEEYPDNAFIVFTQLNPGSAFHPYLFFRQPKLPVCYRSNRQTSNPNDIFNVLRGEKIILIRQIDLMGTTKIFFAVWEENVMATGMTGRLPLYRILNLVPIIIDNLDQKIIEELDLRNRHIPEGCYALLATLIKDPIMRNMVMDLLAQ